MASAVADGGNGCFISTAAYGSPLAAEVRVLRAFRDQYLMTNAPGRAFVRIYYRHSPPLAAIISRNESLRAVSRMVLTPAVYAVQHPVQAWLIVMLLIGSAVAGRRLIQGRRGRRA